MLYGATLATNINELEQIDRKVLQQYLKAILYSKQDILRKLLDRICVRIRIPALWVEIEKQARSWTLDLTKKAYWHCIRKVTLHARESLKEIKNLSPQVPLRKYLTTRNFNHDKWSVRAFNTLRGSTLTENTNSRVVDPVKENMLERDILETPDLDEAERRSAWRYIIYRFPLHTATTIQEDDTLILLLKESPMDEERRTVVGTVKAVHRRDTDTRITQENRGERANN